MSYIGKSPAVAALTASDITDGIISNAKLAQDIISANTALGAEPATTDEFLVSDAGVLKRMDYSHIKGGGKVLQVIHATNSTEATNTSATFADTGLTLAITPSATSSKILITVFNGGTGKETTTSAIGANCQLKLFRDSTEISFYEQTLGYTATATTNRVASGTMYLDSPSSTSAITYKSQFAASGGTDRAIVQGNGSMSTITVMEIGA